MTHFLGTHHRCQEVGRRGEFSRPLKGTNRGGGGGGGVVPVAPDGGWGWVVVVATFLLNLLNGGIFSVHGMLYEAFLHTFPNVTPTSTAWIISLQAGFCYVAGFTVGPVLALTTCCNITVLGALLVSGGLFAVAFVHDTALVYTLFSIVAGCGLGFQCLPSAILVQHYFDSRRAIAGGIALSGGGAGVFVLPPLFRILMDIYGWRGSLIIFSGVFLNSLPLALLLRPLPPPPTPNSTEDYKSEDLEFQNKKIHHVTKTTKEKSKAQMFLENLKVALDFSVLKTLAPWVTCVFYFLSYFGITAFYTFITVKCSELKLPNTYATILISLYGVLETISRLVSGTIGNLPCVNRMYVFCGGMFICGLASAISGTLHTYPLLVAYVIVIGLNIGTFVGLGCTVVVDLVGKALLPKVQGFNFLAGGMGTFVSLPILAAAWEQTKDYNLPFFISGSCQMLAAILLLSYYLLYWRRHHKALVRERPVGAGKGGRSTNIEEKFCPIIDDQSKML